MGKKLILSEEEKQRIKGLYADIISEQSEMMGKNDGQEAVDEIMRIQGINDDSFWFYPKGEDDGYQVQFTGEIANGQGDSLGKPTLELYATLNPFSDRNETKGTVEFVCSKSGGFAQAALNFGELGAIVGSNNFGEPKSPEYIVYNKFCKNVQ